MSKNTLKLLSVVVLSYAFLLSSCVQKSSKPTSPKPIKIGAESQDKSLSSIDSEIYLGDKLTTLRKIVSSNNKKLSVFQFSGVVCQSCQEDSPEVQRQLKQLTNVASYVIFPNVEEAYTKDRYLEFVSKYASGVPYLVDQNLDVLLSVRNPNIESQFFGIYLIVKPDGTAKILNEESAFKSVVEEVKKSL